MLRQFVISGYNYLRVQAARQTHIHTDWQTHGRTWLKQ